MVHRKFRPWQSVVNSLRTKNVSYPEITRLFISLREASADHEAGRVPVMPVLPMSRDCSASKLVQEEGRLPTTFRSPSKLKCVSDVSVDQEDGRLPS